MLEAFELSSSIGDKALTTDELLFMADARKRKGCKAVETTLTVDERRTVIRLGMKCKEWKERNR